MKEIERRLRVSDMVMKFITVRIDEKLKRIEKRKKAREKRAARKPAPLRSACARLRLDRRTGELRRRSRRRLPNQREPSPAHPAEGREVSERKERRIEIMAEQRGGRPIAASQRPTGGDKAIATGKKQYFRRKKVCRFCVDKVDDINYKE